MSIRTVTKPAQYGGWYAVVLDGDGRFVLGGPPRRTKREAVAEALRFYAEKAHLPRQVRPEERVTFGGVDDERREARTVSSMIHGKSAAAYWGG